MVAIHKPKDYSNNWSRPAKDIVYQTGGLKTFAAERSGIRAENFWQALESLEELTRQKVEVDRPLAMVKSAVVQQERRNSAKDMALFEVLLAIARKGGIGEVWHEVDSKLLMGVLQIENKQRLLDALIRIATTSMRYDLQVDGVGHVVAVNSLIEFQFAIDDPDTISGDLSENIKSLKGKIRYRVPYEIRQMFGVKQAYTWISLAAIANFRCMYSDSIYQMLAARAGYDKLFADKPLKIAAKDLARQLGWNSASRGAFNHTLFSQKVVTPALEDINRLSNLTGFTVSLKAQTRSKKAEPEKLRADGRPRVKYKTTAVHGKAMDDLEFVVSPVVVPTHQGLALTRSPKVSLSKAVMDFVMFPDVRHDSRLLPSIRVFQTAVYKWFRSSAERIAIGVSDPAEKHIHFPKRLSKAWRVALDMSVDDPEGWISANHQAFEINLASDDRMIGIDKFFIQWVEAGPTTLGKATFRPDQKAPKEPRLPPENKVFKERHYKDFIKAMEIVDDRKEDYDFFYAFYAYLDHMWDYIAAQAPADIKLGGLTKAMAMMARAHPARQVMTMKTLYTALWNADFKKIEDIMKSVYANKDKLNLHPRTGKPVEIKVQLSLLDLKASNLQLQG